MKTLIKNARIISPGIDLPGLPWKSKARPSTAVYPAGSELPAADKVMDAEGRMLLPGFIVSTATAPAAATPATPSWKASAPLRNAR